MTKNIKFETLLFQALVILLAAICFVSGGVGAFGGLNLSSTIGGGELIFDSQSILRGFADNQYRFGFGIFFTQGFILLFFLKDIQKHANLFRFTLLSMFVGGIARVTNVLQFGMVDDLVFVPIIVELVVMPLLVLWHIRIINKFNVKAS